MNSEEDSLQKLARPDLLQYAIASRHWKLAWPAKYSRAIREAWEKVEAGTHTLCTGRTGDFFVLYLQPTFRTNKGLNA